MKIFLDMDGVLVDMVGGLHQALDLKFDARFYPYEFNKYGIFPDIIKRKGEMFTEKDLYEVCEHRKFWTNLKKEHLADEIVSTTICQVGLDNVYICSYPMSGPETWAGKVEWIDRYFPMLRKNMILCTTPKHIFAKENHILIDDKNENCTDFVREGGHAFLIPQPWNLAHPDFNNNWLPRLEKFLKEV